MTTILEEANAGAFTTKGQAIDRRDELVEIDRREITQAFLKRPFFFESPWSGSRHGAAATER